MTQRKKKHERTAARTRHLNREARRKRYREQWQVAETIAKFEGVEEATIEAYRGHPMGPANLRYHALRKSQAAKGQTMTGRPLPGKHFTRP